MLTNIILSQQRLQIMHESETCVPIRLILICNKDDLF